MNYHAIPPNDQTFGVMLLAMSCGGHEENLRCQEMCFFSLGKSAQKHFMKNAMAKKKQSLSEN